jgi:hypothetical protein
MTDDEHDTATDAKRLVCQQCDKRFTRPENLARHMKTRELPSVTNMLSALTQAGKSKTTQCRSTSATYVDDNSPEVIYEGNMRCSTGETRLQELHQQQGVCKLLRASRLPGSSCHQTTEPRYRMGFP